MQASGKHGAQDVPHQQQGAVAPENELGPVIHLDPAAKVPAVPGPLGIGVPAIPLPLVQGDPVGVGGGRRCAAGQAQGAFLMIAAVELAPQARQGHRRVGQPGGPVPGEGQDDPVSQCGEAGQGSQTVHAHLSVEGPAQSHDQHIQPQQKP